MALHGKKIRFLQPHLFKFFELTEEPVVTAFFEEFLGREEVEAEVQGEAQVRLGGCGVVVVVVVFVVQRRRHLSLMRRRRHQLVYTITSVTGRPQWVHLLKHPPEIIEEKSLQF